MNKESFKQAMKDIHYVSGKLPGFKMTPYDIKFGISCVIIGDQMNFL